MGKEMNKKLWAMFLVVAMVSTAFVAFTAIAKAPATPGELVDAKPLDVKISPSVFNGRNSRLVNAKVLNEDLSTTMSPGPGPTPEGTFSYNFDSDTAGLLPPEPPWYVTGAESGQQSTFNLDNFDDDTVGGNPGAPWLTDDGASATYYWGVQNFDHGTAGQPIPTSDYMGTDGYFQNIDVLEYISNPGADPVPPAQVYTGHALGPMSAHYQATAAGTQRIFGPAGIGTQTTALAGCWIDSTSTQRADLCLLYYEPSDGLYHLAVEVALYYNTPNYVLVHWPGGTGTLVGVTVTQNAWHDMWIEYDDTAQTYSIWWDNTEYAAGSAYMAAGDISAMCWLIPNTSTFNGYIDNMAVMAAPTGTAEVVNVVNSQSHSASNSVMVDQNAAASPNIAKFWNPFTIDMAGTGYWDFWVRPDSVANTNGAIFEMYDQSTNGAIQIRANGGNWQRNNGGAWSTMEAVVATTWVHFNVTFDTVAKSYTIYINSNSYTGSFNRQSGTLIGMRYTATAATQSTYYIDDVKAYCDGAGANITVSTYAAHSGANALRFQEYNAGSQAQMLVDMGSTAGYGAVGSTSFWFYSTQNWGGLQIQLEGDQTLNIIGLGMSLSSGEENGGICQISDGGYIAETEYTYTVNTWTQLAVDYNCLLGNYYIRWNGAGQTGPYGLFLPATYCDAWAFFGGATTSYSDFLYDDFSQTVNEWPTPPTDCRATLGTPLSYTWDNDTVDQDNPVEGTVTGTYANIDENPPTGDLESIQEYSPAASSGQNEYTYSGVTTAGPHNAYAYDADSMAASGPACTDGRVEATNAEYIAITTSDDSRWITVDPAAGDEMFVMSDFATSGLTIAWVDRVTLACEIQAAAATDYQLWAHDWVGNTWVQYTTVTAVAAVDYQVWVNITTNAGNYINSGNGTLEWGIYQTDSSDLVRVDRMNASVHWTSIPSYSLEHRWRTTSVPTGTSELTLFATGYYSAGSNDNFQIGYSTALGGPYTSVITINSATTATYSAALPTSLSGVLYLNVIDSNTADTSGQDTVYLDAIRIQAKVLGGASLSTQVPTADNAVSGTVTGAYTLINTYPDNNAQQVQETLFSAATTLWGPENMDGPALPTGWQTYLNPGYAVTNVWLIGTFGETSPNGDPSALIEWDALRVHASLESMSFSTVAHTATTVTFFLFQQGDWGDIVYLDTSTDSTGGGTGTWTTRATYSNTGGAGTGWMLKTQAIGAVDGQANVHIRFRYDGTDGNLAAVDGVIVNATAGYYRLEHRWTMQNAPVNSLSRTLYVRARYSTGSNDNFNIGWATAVGGPYTTVTTVTSDTFTVYSASIPVTFNGAFYINVDDASSADTSGVDSVYIDSLWVNSTTVTQFTGVQLNWTLSTDDGGGENDIVAYNIYRADQEDGDTLAGPFSYIGNSASGISTYIDVGEGVDRVNQAWYVVEAEDTAGQTAISGFFSKLNIAPVTSNVLANGVSPKLTISPGLQTITITADAYDDSSQFEAIPKMNYAEMYVDTDPGQGSGTPLTPVDAVWDTTTESLTGGLTMAFTPGTYQVWVRTAEDQNGSPVYGAAMNVTIEVIDGPPTANANVDQTVPQHTLVTFDGSLSTDDVGIANYWWTFTDGTPQNLSGVSPTYTFDNEGTFVVTLTVADTIGQTDTDDMTVIVTDGDPPIANAGVDQTKLKGTLTTFDGSGSYDPGHDTPPDRGITNWTWTFTDGGAQEIWGKNPTYTFNTPGTYTVTLTVADAVPLTAVDIMDVTVQDYANIDITAAAGATDGWILISFPTKISGDPLSIIVDGLDEGAGLVTWDVIQHYDILTTSWQTTATFKPTSMNTFNYVDNLMGFWLHITNIGDGNLAIVGDVPASLEVYYIDLYAGWNLIGYPCMTTQDMSALLGGSLFQIAGTEVYDPTNSNGYRTIYWDPWTPGYNLAPGVGIWILMYDYEQWVLTCP